jgi:DNA repair protein RadA/Sms
VETLLAPEALSTKLTTKLKVKPQKLADAKQKPLQRLKTGIEELDRVLGGGIVPGSVVLLAGDPGIGKSTLLLQIASLLNSLYVAGEESVDQVRMRAGRLGLLKGKLGKFLFVLAETDVDQNIAAAKSDKYQVMVVDSIQTMITDDLQSAAGSLGQVRETAYRLHRLAKESDLPIFLIGHVTKEGSIAGPRVLEHLVDTVLYLQGEQEGFFRLLTASKNRFGPVDEIGVFEMNEEGLHQVKNPSEKFLESQISAPGSVVVPVMEGSRAILTEIQALTNQSNFGLPIRRSLGIDQTRLQLLIATLAKRAGVFTGNQDVFVNVAGGLQIRERGVDLGVCLAIASSVYDKVISKDTIAIGEVGLLGEIRATPFLEKRIAEAKRLGFKKFITSKQVKTLREAIKLALSLKG